MEQEEASRRRVLLQRLAVVLLLLAAAFPRARHLEASFDRGADGERGSAAALTQLNFERVLGLKRAITALELPEGTDRYQGLGEPPWEALVRKSHSPIRLDQRLERASFSFLKIDPAQPDAPVEFAVRTPFLAVHLLALLVFWWAIATAMGGQIALLALAFLAVMSPAIAYAGLTGTENFALLFGSLWVGLYARYLRKRELWSLLALIPVSFLATFSAPETLPLVALLPLHALVSKRRREFVLTLLCTCGPLLLLFTSFGAESLAFIRSREVSLSSLTALLRDTSSAYTPITLAIALLGLGLRDLRNLKPNWRSRLEALEFPAPTPGSIEIAGTLFGFGLCAILLGPDRSGTGEDPQLLPLAPALALGTALFLQQLTRPIARMRAGLAPLVVAVSLIAMPGLARFGLFERDFRSEPTPRTVGGAIRALNLPAGSLCGIPQSAYSGPALEFYAGRTLVPQTFPDRAEVGSVAVERGILPWTYTLLLPVGDDQPEDVKALRKHAELRGQLIGQNASWEAWRLAP